MNSMEVLTDIVEILIGGIKEFGSGLASGMNSFIKSLFLDYTTSGSGGAPTYNGLSTFGIIVIVFMAIALATGITRWVVNFVRNRG